jgi:16S rRNA (guanine527-N7)-methyltransferase
MFLIDQKKQHCFNLIEKFFPLTSIQKNSLEQYVTMLLSKNNSYNLIGNSTIENIWDRHILDCSQLIKFIDNKNLRFADFGSGAGLPGIILSILGLKEMHLIEKSFRKSEFLKEVKILSSNRVFVHNCKLEEINNINFDVIISRALAPLPKLIDYSLNFLKPEGFCLFLKGKKLKLEIDESKKLYNFDYELFPSITADESNIIKIKNLSKLTN